MYILKTTFDVHKYFFAQKDDNLHYPNFSKNHVNTKRPKKTVLKMCKHLRESMQSFVSLFRKTLGRDDSCLLVIN